MHRAVDTRRGAESACTGAADRLHVADRGQRDEDRDVPSHRRPDAAEWRLELQRLQRRQTDIDRSDELECGHAVRQSRRESPAFRRSRRFREADAGGPARSGVPARNVGAADAGDRLGRNGLAAVRREQTGDLPDLLRGAGTRPRGDVAPAQGLRDGETAEADRVGYLKKTMRLLRIVLVSVFALDLSGPEAVGCRYRGTVYQRLRQR